MSTSRAPLVLSDEQLWRLVTDDVPAGDLTTEALGITGSPAEARFQARDSMTVGGSEEAARIFELLGARVDLVAFSGERLVAGETILVAYGDAGAVHRAWKVAQTLIEWASGLATAAAALVAAAEHEGRRVPVVCTRKTVPGSKELSLKAVRAGGARVHRLGLSETLLVFAEHRVFLDGPAAATVARLHADEPEKKVVVEVATQAEGLAWARAGADVLQLERFAPAEVGALRDGVRAEGLTTVIAVAGGVKAANAVAYVAAGADLLVTSAPYSAPPKDVAVTIDRGSASVG